MLGIAAGILVGAVSGVAFYCLLCRNAEYIDAFDEDLVRERFMEDMNNKTRMEWFRGRKNSWRNSVSGKKHYFKKTGSGNCLLFTWEKLRVYIKQLARSIFQSPDSWVESEQPTNTRLPKWGREYGRGWGTKGQKQIRFETFSLFLLRPASARKDVTEWQKGVQFLGRSPIVWFWFSSRRSLGLRASGLARRGSWRACAWNIISTSNARFYGFLNLPLSAHTLLSHPPPISFPHAYWEKVMTYSCKWIVILIILNILFHHAYKFLSDNIE